MTKVIKKSKEREKFELLSSQMRLLVVAGQYETVNQALKAHYATQGHTELHTYREWLLLGRQVRKGEKALMLWSKPLKKTKKNQETGEEELTDDAYKHHGVCYVFSNLQIKD